MFAIYTPNGRTFSGPLETLRGLQRANSPHDVRKHQDIDDMQSSGQKGYAITPKAIDAYREVINKPNNKEPIYHAYQVMTSPVQALSANSSFKAAMEEFQKHPFAEFPIIDNRYQLIGSLSRQQVYDRVVNKDADYEFDNKNKTIAQLFLDDDTKVFAAEPITDIRRIAGLLVEQQLHIVPVAEQSGKIVGIISQTDIIKAVMKDPPLSLWA